MASWSYHLKLGKELREAIDMGDPQLVLTLLWDSYKELLDADLIDDFDFDRYTGDFELYDTEDDDYEENVDFELDNFYDLCDSLRVWVTTY